MGGRDLLAGGGDELKRALLFSFGTSFFFNFSSIWFWEVLFLRV
jgi:hypothetical protein